MLVDDDVVCPFPADGAAPALRGGLEVDVGDDEAPQVEGLVMRGAVLGPARNGDPEVVELAPQRHVDLVHHAVLRPPVDVLPQRFLGLLHTDPRLHHPAQHLLDTQRPHQHQHHEMILIDGRTVALDVLVLLLDDDGVLFFEQAFFEGDFVVGPAFEGGVDAEGLEVDDLLAVEEDGAVHGPGEVVAAVLAEAHAAGLELALFEADALERQIDFIFDFILLDLAEKAGKEDLLHLLVGQAVGQEAERALVGLLLAVPAPEAVGVARPAAAVAHLLRLAELQVPGGPRADALVAPRAAVPDIPHEVLVVAGRLLRAREESLDELGDGLVHLVGDAQLFLAEEVQHDLPAALAALAPRLRLLEQLDEALRSRLLVEALGLASLGLARPLLGAGLAGAASEAVDLGEPVDKITPEIFTHLILKR